VHFAIGLERIKREGIFSSLSLKYLTLQYGEGSVEITDAIRMDLIEVVSVRILNPQGLRSSGTRLSAGSRQRVVVNG
jgi:hypothetical protein